MGISPIASCVARSSRIFGAWPTRMGRTPCSRAARPAPAPPPPGAPPPPPASTTMRLLSQPVRSVTRRPGPAARRCMRETYRDARRARSPVTVLAALPQAVGPDDLPAADRDHELLTRVRGARVGGDRVHPYRLVADGTADALHPYDGQGVGGQRPAAHALLDRVAEPAHLLGGSARGRVAKRALRDLAHRIRAPDDEQKDQER